MKHIQFVFLLPLLQACFANSEIAEDPANISAVTRIDENRSDWCQTFCEYRDTCTNTSCDCGEPVCYCLEPLDMPECLQSCAEHFDAYVGHGEACAQEGLDQMECIDGLSCEQMARGVCLPTSDDESACDGDGEPPPESTTPSGSGLVLCDVHQSEGDPAGALFECTTEGLGCSDGHDYWVSCIETQDHRGYCMCSVDQQQTASFYLPELGCPSEADINVGCGFYLIPPENPPPSVECEGAAGGGGPAGRWGCSSDYLCGGSDYSVVCSDNLGYPACDCYVDGAPVQRFIVPDGVCPTGEPPEGLARINAGCGWALY